MRGNSQELDFLATFLNLQLGGKTDRFGYRLTILSALYGPTESGGASPQAVEFVRTHGPWSTTEAIDVQAHLRLQLRDLVDPESIIPIHAGKEVRERAKRIVDRLVATQERLLAQLIRDIDRANITSHWFLHRPTAKRAAGKKPNLHVRGSAWLLEGRHLGAKNTIYNWLIRVLERDDISKLGCCRTCGKFFVRNRPWQLDCNSKCKKNYDNALSAERKAATKQQRKSGRDEKRELFLILSSNNFGKRLPGGPNARAKTQTGLLKSLDICPTAEEFKRQCDPKVKQIIDVMT
jgi:hypothetical protein